MENQDQITIGCLKVQIAEMEARHYLPDGHVSVSPQGILDIKADAIREMLEVMDKEVVTPFVHTDWIKDYADNLEKGDVKL